MPRVTTRLSLNTPPRHGTNSGARVSCRMRSTHLRGSKNVLKRTKAPSQPTNAIGASLPSFFLATSYYVDPLRYGVRVPAAGSNRRWIRVGDDLYLVNMRGRVIQVVPNVFYY